MNLTPKQTIKGTVAETQGLNGSLKDIPSVKGSVAETQSLRGSMKDIPSLDNTLTKEGYAADAKAVGDALDSKAPISHTEDKGNPHGVTASQVGARPDTWMPSASEIGARPDTWMPTASDVGARANTWTPTAQEVGARPDDWMPTADDVGAVPISRTVNGKSLGGDISLTASDVGARENTWMPTAEQVGARANTWMPTASDVGARPNTWIPTADQVGARPNTWTPTAEEVGAEPTKYFNGKIVHKVEIDLGTMPSKTSKTVAHGIQNISDIVSCYGRIAFGGYIVTIPYYESASNMVGVNCQKTNISIITGHDASQWSGRVVVEYTKTTG